MTAEPNPRQRLRHALDALHPSARWVRVEAIDLDAALDAERLLDVIHCDNQCGPDGSLDDCAALSLRLTALGMAPHLPCDACVMRTYLRSSS